MALQGACIALPIGHEIQSDVAEAAGWSHNNPCDDEREGL